MLLSSVGADRTACGLISRQASTGHLAEEKKLNKLAEKKSARSKRCKSLLMLSSPFSSSATSSMKLSLLSLLHPNQNHRASPEQDPVATRRFKQRLSSSSTIATNTNHDNQDPTKSQCQTPKGTGRQALVASQSHCITATAAAANEATNGGATANDTGLTKSSPARPAKCVKMKLFEQPLDKLFSPKAMKQLNSAINSNSSPTSASLTTALGKRKRSSSHTTSSTTNACLRKLFSNNNNNTDPNNNNNSTLTSQNQVKQLLLSVLPEPIRNLLIELYLRGPSTVGIFRKSPNAKHCKELRQKLESDSQSSIQQFQVTVIASVFKEWLRSLPDCLLMSRLYHQWIDVAKLIEPLYQHRQQHYQSQSLDDSLCSNGGSDNTLMQMVMRNGCSIATATTPTSLRPSRSPLTDNGQLKLQPLDRAHSCSTMLMSSSSSTNEFSSINKMRCDSTGSASWASSSNGTTGSPATNDTTATTTTSMSAFALSERHSECLRIVRQLLDALNESNLILLRSFICILWHIAQNSDHNKMSANNLGVCVGQSLLNDEHQPNGAKSGAGGSTFSKRHRRARSQCLLSSTLSLTSSTSMLQNAYLDTSSAQETAKYVPILVAFIIENAPELFGQDIADIFCGGGEDSLAGHHKLDMKSASLDMDGNGLVDGAAGDAGDAAAVVLDDGQNQLPGRSFDQVDAGTAHHRVNYTNSLAPHASATRKVTGDDGQAGEIGNHHQRHQVETCAAGREPSPQQRQIVVESNVFQSSDHHHHHHQHHHHHHHHQQQQLLNHAENRGCNINDGISSTNCDAQANAAVSDNNEDDSSTTTSILIVNSAPQKRHHIPADGLEPQQHRPLSATESTSSSRASSSTSGVHSESSNASSSSSSSDTSSDLVHNARGDASGVNTTTVSSPSPSPSTVSSPSASSTSFSPTQEEQRKHLLSSPCTFPSGESSMEHQTHSSPSPSNQQLLSPEPMKPASATRLQQQQQVATQDVRVVPAARFHNNHMLNRYSAFTGILNRVPKIPVQFTTSSYGGEAVIYNPRPRHSKSADHFNTSIPIAVDDNNSIVTPCKESVIPVKPSSAQCSNANNNCPPQSLPRQQQHHQQQPKSQHELRLERLKEFLAHQSHNQQPLVSAPPSMAYLPQSNYVALHQTSMAVPCNQQQQQQPMPTYPSAAKQHDPTSSYHSSYQQQHPIFYSTANLNSIQQLQQRDHYLLYHRASLNPQRSHVMSLRDYYLSLQLQNQQRQQQQQITYRNRLHPQQHQQQQQQQQRAPDTINKFYPSSQPQQQQQQQQPRGQYSVGYQQPSRTLQTNANNLGAQLTTHHAIQTRPQTRLAKIRQNQFNGIYVNNTTAASDCSVIVPKQVSGTNVGQKVVVKPMSSSSSSSDHSSDESDESMNEAWMESTMV